MIYYELVKREVGENGKVTGRVVRSFPWLRALNWWAVNNVGDDERDDYYVVKVTVEEGTLKELLVAARNDELETVEEREYHGRL